MFKAGRAGQINTCLEGIPFIHLFIYPPQGPPSIYWSPKEYSFIHITWLQICKLPPGNTKHFEIGFNKLFVVPVSKKDIRGTLQLSKSLKYRGKIKAVCCDLGHCSLLFKSDPNAVYSPPNAVYWLQGSFQRSSLLPLLSLAATSLFLARN